MMDMKPLPIKDVRLFVEQNHYSRSVNGVKISQCFGFYSDGELVGAAVFGQLSTTAWKKYGSTESEVLELRRLVLADSCPRNSESWAVAQCLRWIKKNTNVRTVVSYADPFHGHLGIIYQASNWVYVGQTAPDTLLQTPDGKRYHSRAMRTRYNGRLKPFAARLQELHAAGLLVSVAVPGKHAYVYPLRGQKLKGLPYPKRDAA